MAKKQRLRVLKTMKAIEIPKPRRIRVVEMPEPVPGPCEVRVRLVAGGLCGTDLHVYDGLLDNLPRIPGHDVAGVIDELGEGSDPGLLGRRVTVDPAACCLRAAMPVELCDACRRGATHLCVHRTYMGITAPGAFAEKIVVPAARAVPLPDAVDDATATVLEPVVVARHLQSQIADRPGAVLVLGAGPIGLVAAALLAHAGRAITVSEPLPGRRRLARSWGLSDVRSPDEIDEGLAPRVIVEASGHPSAMATIERVAAAGSTVVLVGGATDVPGRLILTRELEVRAAKGGRGLYPEAIALVRHGVIAPGELVSHTFKARDAARAFAYVTANPRTVSRGLLDLVAW